VTIVKIPWISIRTNSSPPVPVKVIDLPFIVVWDAFNLKIFTHAQAEYSPNVMMLNKKR
jgi:hypothetical protein